MRTPPSTPAIEARPSVTAAPHPNVAVPPLTPDADEGGRHDREQGGRGSMMRRQAERDQGRYEECPTADAEQTGEHAGGNAEQDGQHDDRRAHPAINQTPVATSKAENASVSERAESRCWSVAPLTAPTVAGMPTSAAYA